ncbi:hypothetical protein Selin_1469 [Desulfurispirillum indicum S5]|uniref:Uncharacterized protein n=1 Tax=Desulfurispirillum indicum (strain ATCC BAA-1389 / DSM 22839 / S5) TaxID=653733 RepID=E6W6W0_DESIS|nr:hypothetical protein [Desulfurispirillum indicum]ADU66203.1 hypothetical protein Selin_1469 [Desulfurispirillum indicum S5]
MTQNNHSNLTVHPIHNRLMIEIHICDSIDKYREMTGHPDVPVSEITAETGFTAMALQPHLQKWIDDGEAMPSNQNRNIDEHIEYQGKTYTHIRITEKFVR